MADPVFSITSATPTANMITGVVGKLTIHTDIAIVGTFYAYIQVENLVPGKDFNIAEAGVWSNPSSGVYKAKIPVGPGVLTPGTPYTVDILPVCNSQVLDYVGRFTLLASAGGDPVYTVGGMPFTFTITENTDEITLQPNFVTFDTKLELGITRWALMMLCNNTGANRQINTITLPQDTLTEGHVFYDDGAGGWTAWAPNAVTIAANTSHRFLIKLTGATAHSLTGWKLAVSHSGGIVTNWAFTPALSTQAIAACAGLGCVEVSTGAFEWFDGSTVGANAGPGVALTPPNNCGCTSSDDVVIPVTIRNNACAFSCEDGNTGEIRIGNLETGFYPFLSVNSDGATIDFPVHPLDPDSDFLIPANATKVFNIIIPCTPGVGRHNIIYDLLVSECERRAKVTADNPNNPNVITSLGTSTKLAAGAEDIVPVLVSGAVVYAQDVNALSTAVAYDFQKGAAHFAHDTLVFTAPATRHYYVTVQWNVMQVDHVREITLYKNGVAHTVVYSGLYNNSGSLEVDMNLNATDQVALGIYSHDAQDLCEDVNMIIRYEAASAFTPVCRARQVEVLWSQINPANIVVPASKAISGIIGSPTVTTIRVTNNDTAPIVVTGATTDAGPEVAITNPGWPITLAHGAHQDVTVTYTPTVVAAGRPAMYNVHIQGCSDKTTVLSLTATAAPVTCDTEFTNGSYSLNPTQNTPLVVPSTVKVDTGSATGLLVITSACPQVSFPASTYPPGPIYGVNVTPGQTVDIPISVYYGNCPVGVQSCNLHLAIYDTNTGLYCNDDTTLLIDVTCDTPTVCPASLIPLSVVLPALPPASSGLINATLQLGAAVNVLGDMTIEFNLPPMEGVIQFVPPGATVGLTWGCTPVVPNKICVAVNSGVFTGTTIPIVLSYNIPESCPASYIHQSVMTAAITYVENPDIYHCPVFSMPIALAVECAGGGNLYQTLIAVRDAHACRTVNIFDISDYNAQVGALVSDFTLFREITILRPDGTTYVMSTSGSGDQLITPAASNIFAFLFDASQGGLYTFTICSVPTYSAIAAYGAGFTVCVNDSGTIRFFVSNVPVSNVEPLVTPGWEISWAEVARTALPSNMCATTQYVQLCPLNECMKSFARKFYCDLSSLCEADICKDPCLMNYLKLLLINESMPQAIADQNWAAVNQMFETIKTICNCGCIDKS